MIEAHPEYRRAALQLACCESLPAAQTTRSGIKLAIDRNEPFQLLAAEDSDFDPIRDEAAFKELVYGNAATATGE